MQTNVKEASEVDVHSITKSIVEIIFEKRRLLPGQEQLEGNFEEEAKVHYEKTFRAVLKNEAIRLILPAFPAKSPNRRKTLGHLPDLGEIVALKNLKILCQKIEKVYSPGAIVTICSDGRVFADLIRIQDEHVTAYGKKLREYAAETVGSQIDFFDLDDLYPGVKHFDTLREELMITHGEGLSDLRYRIKKDPKASAMYKGMTRFMFEDFSGIGEFADKSRNAIQNEARNVAYRVIQRSNAWSRALEQEFPDAIRLSIHPQMRTSEKIGVYLLDTADVWRTPWHAVTVIDNGKITLENRAEIESKNVALMFKEGRPSHYEVISEKKETALESEDTLSSIKPFGAIRTATANESSVLDLPITELKALISEHKLLILRGFPTLKTAQFEEFAGRFGEILKWEFGSVLDLKMKEDAPNHIFTKGRVELHWDGAFVKENPRYNFFQCLEGAEPTIGGETIFTNTNKVWQLADQQKRDIWKQTTIDYETEKKAHYGGLISNPLADIHPDTNETRIRFIEPYNEDNAEVNPMKVNVQSVTQESEEEFLKNFTARLYQDDVLYEHVWQKGDFLIADNNALLHGRNAFKGISKRHLQRIHVL